MSKGGIFSAWQPAYAAHGIPTFPVTAEKKPATRGYLRTGLRGSTELARKFPHADAFGFACGPRSKVTLLDVDSADERALADALSIYGRTPLISRTASGGYHAWFRYNGEGRLIRPAPDKPLDILGGGVAVAPPSTALSSRSTSARARTVGKRSGRRVPVERTELRDRTDVRLLGVR